jgi:hypothetical protein
MALKAFHSMDMKLEKKVRPHDEKLVLCFKGCNM